ncbi:hypothetical protein BT63DRAFT_231307 [Microthyrium microscopicum]|uniref:Phytochrome-like histidine kinase PHY1p n=1 Tax=Microthyrium microscopicum TaxID=703497 RepID=A0A6A6UD19_9PEZI|nr:hypothetical protein BT63DRAFT_231307 [Microthyrium microscopicum]
MDAPREEEHPDSPGHQPPPSQQSHQNEDATNTSTTSNRPALQTQIESARRPNRTPLTSPPVQSQRLGPMSPMVTDHVFPIRSVVTVDPSSTPAPRTERQEGYFGGLSDSNSRHRVASNSATRRTIEGLYGETPSTSPYPYQDDSHQRLAPDMIDDIVAEKDDVESISGSVRDKPSTDPNDFGLGVVTTRFSHVITDDGHAIITGRDGEPIQRCEDEPIHMPGAIQSYGLLIALQDEDSKLVVRIVSENSHGMIGYSPRELFTLDTFSDILSDEQADNFLDHVDFVREEDNDIMQNGPELFTVSIRGKDGKSIKMWCAMHVNQRNSRLIICELELENDKINPPVHPSEMTPDMPEDTLNSNPSEEEYQQSTLNISKPLRVLRSARKRRGEAAAMEVFNIMSQIQEQLASADSLELFLRVLVGVVKELTGFHRVMIYQFDKSWNGRVTTELLDPRATKDLYKGLNFPASDIPVQARELYKVNRVRLLYDRDQETARLVCRTTEDLEEPLDLTHSYLRAMSPIHIKYLANMSVRGSMSISINAFDELWGLISCHSYGNRGMRVSFPIRKMCRLVGDTASRNIERLSYASRLQARKLINTVPTKYKPSGYIIASSDDLLKLFNADFGLLCIHNETKMLGQLERSQEALAMLEYLKMRKITTVMTSTDIKLDFPDLNYPPGFIVLAGMLLVPLSSTGDDFIAFFRRGQLSEVKWAGNPYEKTIREGTHAFLEPRKSFKIWSETVVGRCRDWTEEETETAAVLCLVYGKFIEVWRQKEAALQSSNLTKLLLANQAHEVRTPLNAIVNYLEIALEGQLDTETRSVLSQSHSASKSLIYVINDLLDLTKTEEGVNLISVDSMDFEKLFVETTASFNGDAKRKKIEYIVKAYPGIPHEVLGDHRKVRQAISNLIANAFKHTDEGSVTVETYLVSVDERCITVDVVVEDTGSGMSEKKVDSLFRDLEQVSSDPSMLDEEQPHGQDPNSPTSRDGALGLGLAIVARIVKNMNGQLRLKSEEGKGSRFVIQFPFEVPPDAKQAPTTTPPVEQGRSPTPLSTTVAKEVLLVDRDSLPRSSTHSPSRMSRKNSSESLTRSLKSMNSVGSNRSDVDRLIEALQEPHMVENKRRSDLVTQESLESRRPPLETRKTYGGPSGQRSASTSFSFESAALKSPVGSAETGNRPGESPVRFSGQPVKAVKIPEPEGIPLMEAPIQGAITGEVGGPSRIEPEFTANNLSVLAAEDDPINNKILDKRLTKQGHKVKITLNGAECATAHRANPSSYDVVLMDLNMPLVGGLESAKMIRDFEATQPGTAHLSPRASLNGRLPIIAVSATLVESKRQEYIDAGCDAWILKPTNFARLGELLQGIIDPEARSAALYTPGEWERGGWFDVAKPKQQLESEGPQLEMLKSRSAPQLRPPMQGDSSGSGGTITEKGPVESPAPIE